MGSYGPTEPDLWLVGKIPLRTWQDCRSTSDWKRRTHTYNDLVELLIKLDFEMENDSHMEKFLKRHLGKGAHPTPDRGESRGSKTPTFVHLQCKCVMPLCLFITTNHNLLAGKYIFSYFPLVLWWPPVSNFKGKREFFLASPWVQHLFKISYNNPNIGKMALQQGSRQVLLSHTRHLQLPLRSLVSLGPLWLGRASEWACQFMCAQPSPSNWQKSVQYAKPNAGYDQGTLSGGSMNLL